MKWLDRATGLLVAVLIAAPALCIAGDLKPVALPAPRMEGGKPLMQALKERKSSREFARDPLPPQILSNLLWAAFGINRDDGRRTAPSAVDEQEIDIYAATADGLYLFVPKGHRLTPVLPGDIRAATGTQPFVKDVPVNLIYVADYAKMAHASADDKILYSSAGAGFIAQNVYLYCASEGLATVVRAMVDRAALAKTMHLRPDQKIILVQSVGYPRK